MSASEILSYDECLARIIKAARNNRSNSSLQYAASYAQAGYGMTGRERNVQIAYITSNLGTYRGDEARLVKASLKHHAKESAK